MAMLKAGFRTTRNGGAVSRRHGITGSPEPGRDRENENVTPPMWIVLGVLAATFILIVAGKLRAELAALGACCLLVVTGVMGAADVFTVFGNEAIVTVGAMFVLSAALERTGVIAMASRFVQMLPVRSERAVLFLLLPPVLAVSAFVNNTPVVVVFLPIIVTLAKHRELAASRLLMPLSFASILGGSTTLIGTSTNLVASSAGERLGLAPIGMFELAPMALVLAGVGLAYLLLFAPRLLPRRDTMTSLLEGASERQYLTEAFVPDGSPLIGRTANKALSGALQKGRLLEVIRHGQVYDERPGTLPLQAGDRLRVNVDAAAVAAITERRDLAVDSGGDTLLALGRTEENRIVECVVGPRSRLAGHTLAEADLRRRFEIVVLALHRRGVNLREHLDVIRLDAGDVLLVEADEATISQLRQGDDLLVLAGGQRKLRLDKRWLAAAAVAGVVAASAMQLVPVAVAALVAAVLVIACGCVDSEEAYQAIDWPVLFLIAGMLGMGLALEKTHTAELLAHFTVERTAALGPVVTLSLVILAASVATNFLSNNAVAALLVPLAVETAHQLQTNPRAFLVAVAMGASACFATPLGYQTNTLVYGAGGYRFGDFLRLGLPLNLLHWLIASALIPVFWPL